MLKLYSINLAGKANWDVEHYTIGRNSWLWRRWKDSYPKIWKKYINELEVMNLPLKGPETICLHNFIQKTNNYYLGAYTIFKCKWDPHEFFNVQDNHCFNEHWPERWNLASCSWREEGLPIPQSRFLPAGVGPVQSKSPVPNSPEIGLKSIMGLS